MGQRRKKGPVTRRYAIEFNVSGLRLVPPEPTAPLREQRRWIDALLIVYPGAQVQLRSLPSSTPSEGRELLI